MKLETGAVWVVGVWSISLLLSDHFFPVSVNAVGDVKTFLGPGEELYAGSYTSVYCLSTWILFQTGSPASTVKPVTLLTNGNSNIGLQVLNNGTIRARSSLLEGSTVTASISGAITANTWLLIAVCACSSGISVSKVAYRGAVSSSLQAVSGTFIEYDPVLSSVKAYGDGVTALTSVQMMGVTLTLDTCLSADVLASQATISSPYCQNCLSPVFSACEEYIQLVNPFTSTVVTSPLTFYSSNPIFANRDYTSLDISITGWFKNTNPAAFLNLFRIQNNLCDISELPSRQCRVMSEFLTSTPTLEGYIDAADAINVLINPINLPSPGTWVFVAASNCATPIMEARHCSSSSASGPVTCVSTPLTGPPFPFLQPLGTATISIGDSFHGSITGEVLDFRYYPNTCLSPSSVNDIITAKQGACVPHCHTCTPPNSCQSCDTGYYLSTGACKSCNSCCKSCTAAGATNCITCASMCTLIGVACMPCYVTCDSCQGIRKSQCLTCRPGTFMQPSASLCLEACPSGYNMAIDTCTGTGSLILSLSFQTILPWFNDDTGNFLVLNGLTETYYPPAFEPSDPVPYKNRGYLFDLGKMVQLPPHLRSYTSEPLSFNVETTIELWIRTSATGRLQPLYWKAGTLPIVTLYIDSSDKLAFAGGFPPVTILSSLLISANLWTRVVFISTFDSTTAETTVTFIVNLASDPHLETFSIQDLDKISHQTIGSSYDQTDYFTGFIWSCKVWNYAWDETAALAAYTPSTPSPGLLLSNCPINAEPTSCKTCLGSCSLGCIRTQDCGICNNPRCLLCDNFNTMECSICIANADLGPYKLCNCRPGRYYNGVTNTCDLCDAQCMSCANAKVANCLGCYPGAELISGANSGCKCTSEYFPNPGPSQCTPCPSSCLTCVDRSTCKTCWPNAHLNGFNCLCNSQYYPAPDASNCLQCGQNCRECNSSGCVLCALGWYIEAGVCVSTCSAGYLSDSVSMICTYDPSSQVQPYASLSISSSTLITISFTKELAVNLQNSDLGMILTDVDSFDYPVKWSVQTPASHIKFPVNIEINSTYLPTDNEFTVYFPNPARLVDLAGLPLAITELTGQIPGFGTLDSNTASTSSTVSTTKTVASGSLASSLVLSLISGNPGTMWSLMNGMALLSYSSCLNINISQELRDFFSTLNVQSYIPNPFQYIFSARSQAPNYGDFDTSLFLLNAGLMFTVGVSLLVYWPFVKLMTRFPIEIIARYYKELHESFRWNIFLRYWTQIYFDVAISAFIQLTFLSFSDFTVTFNSTLAMCFAVLFGLTPSIVTWLVLAHTTMDAKGEIVVHKEYKMLIEGFTCSKGRLRLIYYPLFFMERLLISASLVFLRFSPISQVLICLASATIVSFTQLFAYQLLFQPYSSRLESLTNLGTDGCSVGVYLVLSVYLWPLDTQSAAFYEVIVMSVVLGTVGGLSLLSAYRMIKTIRRLLKEYQHEIRRANRPLVRAVWTFGGPQKTNSALAQI